MNTPKFIRIQLSDGIVFINVNQIERVNIFDGYIEFWFANGYKAFEDDSYPIAKQAWLDYWKVSP